MKAIIKIFIIILMINANTIHSQTFEWLENDLFSINNTTSTMTNIKGSGLSYAMSSNIIEASDDGYFELTNFMVGGNAVNHPSVTIGALSLYIVPSSVTSFDAGAINDVSYSIKLGYLFPTGGSGGTGYKARIFGPDHVELAGSSEITPQAGSKLYIQKTGNSLLLKYEGDQNSSKNISQGIIGLPTESYRIVITVSTADLSATFNRDGFTGDPGSGGTNVIPPTSTDPLNWISTRTYDVNGDYKTARISYFNCLGNPTQSQSKDILTKKMWANEIRYDYQGRPAFGSFSAPLTGQPQNFVYEEDFIVDTDGNSYVTQDFENGLDTPYIVGDDAGSLGWYYSSNNTSEPFQDNTTRPFVRNLYDNLNPGKTRIIAGGKYLDTDGDGVRDAFPQGFSYTMQAAQELYYAFGKDYFPGPNSMQGKEVILQSFKTVTIDPHGNEAVTFTDKEGRILASARSGGSTEYDVIYMIGEQGYVDIHLPMGMSGGYDFIGATFGFSAYNLRTGENVNASNMQPGNIYRLSYNTEGPDETYIHTSGTINYSYGGKGIKYKVNYHDYALNYYDKSGNITQTVQPLGFDTNAYDINTGTPNHDMVSQLSYNARGEVENSNNPDEGEIIFVYREDGQIRFSRNTQQELDGEFSYTNYDDRGRPIESGVSTSELPYFEALGSGGISISGGSSISVTSNTVEKTGSTNWSNSGFVANDYSSTGNFRVSFQFTEGDEGAIGISEVNINDQYNSIQYGMYFMKNQMTIYLWGKPVSKSSTVYNANTVFAIERTGENISFLKDGKPIYQLAAWPSGQNTYPPMLLDGSLYSQGAIVSNILMEDLSATKTFTPPPVDDWVVDPASCIEKVFTIYDVKHNDEINTLLYGSTSAKYYREQRFVAGNISKSYTEDPDTSTTWYSYDIYGRVEWMVQYINGLGAKTIDYLYDSVTGEIVKIIFQRDVAAEKFVHRYSYNDAKQLMVVETSRDDQYFTEHARYTYYETGSLKRVELAEGLQGTDYVYTLSGQLKAINHPDLTQSSDPGEDQNDAFGLILDYHNEDYKRTEHPSLQWTNSGTNRYNGTIKGVRWGTQGLSSNNGYLYEYNNRNWLDSATYGTYSGTTFSPNFSQDYKASNLEYDANGNILGLDRNKSSSSGSNNMDRLSYQYESGTNQLKQVIDASPNTDPDGDIKSQGVNNYTYDGIGRLIANTQDEIGYDYYTNGMVRSVFSTQTGNNERVDFFYNDRGQRVEKRYTTNSGANPQSFYVRAVSGKVIAIYTLPNIPGDPVTQSIEYPIYGSSRLGIADENNVFRYQLNDHLGNVRAVIRRDGNANVILNEDFSGGTIPSGWSSSSNVTLSVVSEELKVDVTDNGQNSVVVDFPVESGKTYRIKFDLNLDETANYLEYIAHTGSVDIGGLPEVADENGNYSIIYNATSTATAHITFLLDNTIVSFTNKYSLDNVVITDITTNETPIMLAYKDYYPFGMPMPSRNIEGEYPYAFQGQEKDQETGMEAFELRLWDARIGRWLTTDPYQQYESPYLGMGNDPANGVDMDGGFRTRFGAWLYKKIFGTGGEIFENDHGTWLIDISEKGGEINLINGSKWEERNLFGNSGRYFLVKDGWKVDEITFFSPEPEHQHPGFYAVFGETYLSSKRELYVGHKNDALDNKILSYTKLVAEGRVGGSIGKVFNSETVGAIVGIVLGDMTADITVVNSIEGVVHTKIHHYGVIRNAIIGKDLPGSYMRYDISSEPQKVFKALYQWNTIYVNGKQINSTRHKL